MFLPYVNVCICLIYILDAWGSDKVLLRDVQVLTLNDGSHTTGRRNSPIPQLKCVGGAADWRKFKPSTVQCYNRGFDGQDVQVSFFIFFVSFRSVVLLPRFM